MKKILLVEDDPFLIEIYSKKLKEEGFEIEVAQDGEKALEKLDEKKFDLILLDIVLPRISGWEVLEKIKDKGLKVLILSNLGQKSEVEKGIKMGAIRYFIKAHYTPSQIVKEIKKVLEK